ncbi:glycosyl hydrolase family 20 [Mycoplasmopsis mustelae]|uniref:Glycosyl hydrolase family 20 n=1 Tax=Mycoplasmopsis mustelae TaxID=171289 RepID=A0A4R7UBZ9_9BACT|nr:beta-N-acetylglucosaminidase domain-containing protein [Mycoplasmopsis mustelae]TDV23070.1 glycosyl hydrolase family 20 [Mycoplasmopsis mustelae]
MNIKKKIKYMLSTAGSFGLLATVATVAAGETASDSSANTTTSTKQEITYNIFPEVQDIQYTEGSISITPEVNLVFENGIDAATIARFDQVLKLRNLTYTKSRNIVSGKTNILVGIKDDTDTLVDNELKTLGITPDATLDNKLDSYMLNAGTFNNGSYITLLAKDATAAFYGATTLWHIFNQLDGFKIRNLTIKDYADLKVRGVMDGFINTSSRSNNLWNKGAQSIMDFMKFAGLYKLNTYIFRPGDVLANDFTVTSKNTAQSWSTLYTDSEIAILKNILEVSKNTKVNFVYSTAGLSSFADDKLKQDHQDYTQALEKLKAKYKQVIEAGVRKIALVEVGADAGNNTKKLLTDLTNWLQELKKVYTDLDTNLLFVAKFGDNEFTSNSDEKFNYYVDLPSGVTPLLINGTNSTKQYIDANTLSKFSNGNRQIRPVFWKPFPNNPSSDYNDLFVRLAENYIRGNDAIDSSQFDGIIMSAVGSSEVLSRFGFFDLANTTWKLLPTESQSEQRNARKKDILDAAVNYVINNSNKQSAESDVFKSLRMHYANNAEASYDDTSSIDSLKTPITELSKKITALSNNDLDPSQSHQDVADAAKKVIPQLQAVYELNKTLLENKSKSDFLTEINVFSQSLDALLESVLYYTQAIEASYEAAPNIDRISNFMTQAKLFYQKSVEFTYHSKAVKVGALYLRDYVNKVSALLDLKWNYSFDSLNEENSDNIIGTFKTSRTWTTGYPIDVTRILGNTRFWRTTDNRYADSISPGDWIGYAFNKPKYVKDIRLKFNPVQVNSRDNYFRKFKVSYQLWNSKDFVDYKENNSTTVKTWEVPTENGVKNPTFNIILDLANVREIRIVDNETDGLTNAPKSKYRLGWIDIYEFIINTKNAQEIGSNTISIQADNYSDSSSSSGLTKITDFKVNVSSGPGAGPYTAQGNNVTNSDYTKINDKIYDTAFYKNNVQANEYFAFKLDQPTDISRIVVQQGSYSQIRSWADQKRRSGDFWLPNADLMYLDPMDNQWKLYGHLKPSSYNVLTNYVKAQHFRIVNRSNYQGLWMLIDINVFAAQDKLLYTDVTDNNIKSKLKTKNVNSTYTLYATDSSGNSTTTPSITLPNDGKYVGLDLKDIYNISSLKLNNSGSIPEDVLIQTSRNGIDWYDYNGTLTHQNQNARYVRVLHKTTKSVARSAAAVTNLETLEVVVNKGNKYGQLIDSSIQVISGWGGNRYSGNDFDGNFDTTNKFGGGPYKDDYIKYDLGSEIALDNIKLYAPADTYDFARYFKVLVSDSDSENAQWTEVYNWGSVPVSSDANNTATNTTSTDVEYPENLNSVKDAQSYSDKTLGDQVYANWVKTDPEHPDLRYWDITGIASKITSTNKNLRYLKIVFTKDIMNKLIKNDNTKGGRDVVFSEIVINGKTFYDAVDPNFSGTNYQAASKNTAVYLSHDGDVSTYYEPKEINGSLKYYIEPDKYQDRDLAIISDGMIDANNNVLAPANVKAMLYDSNTKESSTKDLGLLATKYMTFDLSNLDQNKKLVGFEITWTTHRPQIYEFIPLKRTPKSNSTNDSTTAENQTTPTKESLKAAINAQPAGFENWTKKDQDNYNSVKAQIDALTKSEAPLNQTILNQLQRSLNETQAVTASKVNDDVIEKLTNEVKQWRALDTKSVFQDDNYAKYVSLAQLAENAIAATSVANLTQQNADSLLQKLTEAKKLLNYTTFDQQLAENNLDKVQALNPSHYTPETYAKIQNEINNLKQKINSGTATIADYQALNTQFDQSYQTLELSDLGKKYQVLQENIQKAQDFVNQNAIKFPDQVKQVQQQIAQLQDVLNNKDASLEQLQDATKQIKTSTDDAESRKQQALNNFKQLVQNQIANKDDIYTPESYQAYSDAINKAKVKLDASDTLTNEEILDLQNQIQLAQNQLTIANDKVDAAKSNVEPLVTQLESPEIQKQYQELLKAATTPEKLAKAISDINTAIKDQKVEKETLKDQVQRDIDSIKDPEKKAELQKEFDALKASNATNDKFSEFRSQTLAESLKSIFKSQQSTNNADATKDKPENPESKPTNPTNQQPSKSKNTAIIVISVLIALAVIGGLIGAWYAARSIKKKKANK